MAELNKEPQSDVNQNRPKRSKAWLWISILALLGLLGLGALVFYLHMQNQGQQKGLSEKVSSDLTKQDQQVMELTQQISGYQTQIAAIQSQLANMQQSSSGKDTHFNQALDDFSKLHTEKLDMTRNEFKTSLDQVLRLLGKTRTDWMIADAEYLLNVANQRLMLTGDIGTAKLALEAADARLRESEDAAVYKVREQVVKELEALNKVTVLDVVGLYSKINALQQTANQLNVKLPYVGKQEKTAGSAQDKASADAGLLDKALVGVKDIVSIKHIDVPVAGILSKEEAQFSLQQIKVRLDMVKMSLLQQNEDLYLASIADVKQWLKENFTLDAVGNDFLKRLDELEAIKIRSQLPNINESLTLLKAITKTRAETDKILPKIALEPKGQTAVAAPAPAKPDVEKTVPATSTVVKPPEATAVAPVKSVDEKTPPVSIPAAPSATPAKP